MNCSEREYLRRAWDIGRRLFVKYGSAVADSFSDVELACLEDYKRKTQNGFNLSNLTIEAEEAERRNSVFSRVADIERALASDK